MFNSSSLANALTIISSDVVVIVGGRGSDNNNIPVCIDISSFVAISAQIATKFGVYVKCRVRTSIPRFYARRLSIHLEKHTQQYWCNEKTVLSNWQIHTHTRTARILFIISEAYFHGYFIYELMMMLLLFVAHYIYLFEYNGPKITNI